MKALIIVITFLVFTLAAQARDRAGNGGDFNEMQFISLAYEDLDVLQVLAKSQAVPVDLSIYTEKLQDLRVTFVTHAQLSDGPRSAVNFPGEDLIQVDQNLWNSNTDTFSRLNLVLHEMLWLSGVDDTAYAISTPLFGKMRPLLETRDGAPSKTPILLYSFGMEDISQGMDTDTAATTCELQKEIYKKQYYFVYCVYYERSNSHIVMAPVDDAADSYLVSLGLIYARHQDRWESIPETKEKFFYGLRVFGLGEMGKLTWKVIASSLNIAGGLVCDKFDTQIEANIACHERLAQEDQNSLEFSGAVCRIVQGDDHQFYYEIVTQNPLVDLQGAQK